MTDRELDQLERDARKPNYGGKYYPPATVLALIEELKAARRVAIEEAADLAEELLDEYWWRGRVSEAIRLLAAPLSPAKQAVVDQALEKLTDEDALAAMEVGK